MSVSLPACDADVGAHHGVAVAVFGQDVIGALGHQHDRAGRARWRRSAAGRSARTGCPGRCRTKSARAESSTLPTRPSMRSPPPAISNTSRVGSPADLDRLRRAGEPEGDMDDVVAGRQHEGRLRGRILLEQAKHAGLVRLVGIDPPVQAAVDGGAVAAVARRAPAPRPRRPSCWPAAAAAARGGMVNGDCADGLRRCPTARASASAGSRMRRQWVRKPVMRGRFSAEIAANSSQHIRERFQTGLIVSALPARATRKRQRSTSIPCPKPSIFSPPGVRSSRSSSTARARPRPSSRRCSPSPRACPTTAS